MSMEDVDHFGTTYEHLLSEFASDSGKKAGEFYTPSSVAQLISDIASYNRTKIQSIWSSMWFRFIIN
ncbi:N-6 DNA methylase [Mesomycoplasma neurolyticum]|uniref:site-specific DNA-methyltransferase (adenine-specific) n=1 Tax=Mesomycoplasma neurolyticum TaxID=2120 RepID=A0A449A6G7_9BACT|nr:N-6 DNA methylase [Mesomycoplasma neurolyticum]VEU59851.1 Type I restriction-modification system methyltransferase subunit [Mesomycoplasma neurolyticum]